ncbi:MAG: hypothetical protein WAN92_04540 [Herbaspirillum sp.]
MRKRLYFSHVVMVGLMAVILALSATLVYYLRDLLLSPDRISSMTGPQEGYYWTAAQYQIAYLQFRNQVNLYANGVDKDTGILKLRHDILQSKFRVLAYPSELTHFFREIPSYDSSVHTLKDVMRHLERDMRLALHEPRSAHMLTEDMRDGWRLVTTIANDTRAAEMQHREQVFSDFYAKRRIIFINGAILLVLLVITLAALLMALRRTRAALNAERQAVKARNAFLAVVSHELRVAVAGRGVKAV